LYIPGALQFNVNYYAFASLDSLRNLLVDVSCMAGKKARRVSDFLAQLIPLQE
jgi:hypothetical protein